jgi:hypothetical protein
MQLTRAVLAIALAASNANALPAESGMSGERNNAQHRDGANIEDGSVAVQKRSHYPGHLQGNLASDRGQREEMNDSQGGTAAQMNTKAHHQDVNAILNGSGQRSEGLIQITQTPESRFKDQDSTRSFADKNMPSIQQNSAAESENMAKTKLNKAANNHGTAVASNNKAGFTLKVRELIKSLAQGREQMHRGSGQQNQDEHRTEHSIGIRRDQAEGQSSSNEMNMDMDNLIMGHDAQAGMLQNQDTENQNRNQVPATQDGDNVNQEISRVSAPMGLNNKVLRSHTGLSLSMPGHQEGVSNSNQENRDRMQQQQQQQQEQINPRSNNQMQSHSQMMECLRAARGDIHQYVSIPLAARHKNGFAVFDLVLTDS